ncbi:MAG: cation transporter [Succinivibrionaceae bacterium]|nr:cation transporter [Succinivibrionaceae bacterium]
MENINGSYGRLIRSAISLSIALAVLLTVCKFGVWWFSGSETMLASLLDSVMDGLGAGITFFAVRVSLAPPDNEHNFGHGKAEAIAGLLQAVTVGVTVALVIWHSITQLLHPEPMAHTFWALTVTVVSMLLEILVIRYQMKIISLTQSAAVKADNIHIRADLLFNLGVVMSLAAVELTGVETFDSIFAIALGLVILYGAFSIGRTSINILLDHEIPQQIVSDIRSVVNRFPEVSSLHCLRTRQSGHVYFVQMHLVMNGSLSLARVHRITDRIEDEIRKLHSNMDVMIHAEPEDNQHAEERELRDLYGKHEQE